MCDAALDGKSGIGKSEVGEYMNKLGVSEKQIRRYLKDLERILLPGEQIDRSEPG